RRRLTAGQRVPKNPLKGSLLPSLRAQAAHAVERFVPSCSLHLTREPGERHRHDLVVMQTLDTAVPGRVEPEGMNQIDVGVRERGRVRAEIELGQRPVGIDDVKGYL